MMEGCKQSNTEQKRIDYVIMTKQKVTCVAPINIAVVKYWGKTDENLNLPLNSSLSITLDPKDLCTKTTVSVDESYEEDEISLNGIKEDITKNKRIQRCLKEARRLSLKRKHDTTTTDNNNKCNGDVGDISRLKCRIESWNNFPTAAGLASSASGYSCLAKCLGELYKLDTDLSLLARLGSGSACRSMHGGYVKWMRGDSPTGSDSCAVQVADAELWNDLRIFILVVSNKQKSVPSTEGMRRSVQTSDLLKYRVEHIVEDRIEKMETAILNKDFKEFAELTMKDSNQLHAICQDTYPPITPPYMNDISHRIVKLVTEYNKERTKAAYTFDAGANAVLFTLKQNEEELLATILKYFPASDITSNFINLPSEAVKDLRDQAIELAGVDTSPDSIKKIIVTKPGHGASVVDGQV